MSLNINPTGSASKWLVLILLLAVLNTSCSLYQLCPIPSCQVRMLHAHSGVTYRGQPWWRIKRQNPKVGQQYVFTKDKNLVPKDTWFNRVFGKKQEKKTSKDADFEGIKARDPNSRHGSKDFDTEEPEEDKEEEKEKQPE